MLVLSSNHGSKTKMNSFANIQNLWLGQPTPSSKNRRRLPLESLFDDVCLEKTL